MSRYTLTQGMRQQLRRNAQYERELRALKRERDMVEVPFEWQTKAERDASLFATYGWVPHVAMRFRQSNGTVVPYTCGREGDVWLMAPEFAAKKEHEGR